MGNDAIASTQSPTPKTLISSKCGELAHPTKGMKRILYFLYTHLCTSFLLAVALLMPFLSQDNHSGERIYWVLIIALIMYKVESVLLGGRKCPNCGKRNTLINLNSPDGQRVQTLKSQENAVKGGKAIGSKNINDSAGARKNRGKRYRLVCTKCGSLQEFQAELSSQLGIVVLKVFLCVLIVSIIDPVFWSSPRYWFLAAVFLIGPFVVAGLGPPSNCPICGGEKTLIDTNSPMGRKILQDVSNQQAESERSDGEGAKNVEGTQIIGSPTVRDASPGGFCTECGAPKSASDKFCHKCGKAFNQS